MSHTSLLSGRVSKRDRPRRTRDQHFFVFIGCYAHIAAVCRNVQDRGGLGHSFRSRILRYVYAEIVSLILGHAIGFG